MALCSQNAVLQLPLRRSKEGLRGGEIARFIHSCGNRKGMADAFRDKSVAAIYSDSRPTIPPSIVDEIVKFYQNGDSQARITHAIDVGCGGGQFSLLLAAAAGSVTAVDFSEAQIKEAKAKRDAPNITYLVGSYEDLPAKDGSIDLITSAQAAHFFDPKKFHAEVDRCLHSGGCLALTGYGPAELENVPKEINDLNTQLLDVQFRPYWFHERHLVDNCYRDMPMPYPSNLKRFDTFLHKDVTTQTYSTYLKSTTAYYFFKKQAASNTEDIVDQFISKLSTAVEKNRNFVLKVRWPVFLLMTRK